MARAEARRTMPVKVDPVADQPRLGHVARCRNVDRIASTRPIRRLIDPQAWFRFVRAKKDVPEPGELRSRCSKPEFTDEGDRCTSKCCSRGWV